MKPSQIILSLAILATTTQGLPLALSINNRADDVARLNRATPERDVSPLEYGRGLIAALAEEEEPDATAIEYGLIAAREAVAQEEEPDITALEYGLIAAREVVAQEEEPDATAIEYALLKSAPIADRTPTVPTIIVNEDVEF